MPTPLRYLLATVLVLSWCEGRCRWDYEGALGDLWRRRGPGPCGEGVSGPRFPVCQMSWLG